MQESSRRTVHRLPPTLLTSARLSPLFRVSSRTDYTITFTVPYHFQASPVAPKGFASIGQIISFHAHIKAFHARVKAFNVHVKAFNIDVKAFNVDV
ncbi:MAG: hypothetical protein JSS81_25515, partial [Acidobacteria bacterium]|nr:hypothetical protein [Acidobacteriota bacterium]